MEEVTQDTNNEIKATNSHSNSNKEIEKVSNAKSSSSSDPSIFNLDLVGSRICQIIVPVTLCSIYVVILVRILEWNVYYSRGGFIEKAWSKLGLNYQGQAESSLSNLFNNIIIVSVFILLLIVISLVMLFVLYMNWYSWLSYYFYLPSITMMSILTPIYIREILNSQDYLTLDLITLLIFTWNFTILGLISIFSLLNTSGPLYLQQFYLIHNSTILAVVILTSLPSWTPWLLLGLLVLWDLFAVLAPFGPLKLIINMAEKVGVIEMPGLVYTTDSKPHRDSSESKGNKSVESEKTPDENEKMAEKSADNDDEHGEEVGGSSQEESREKKSMEDDGVNIGLGDFIFYSLLIGLTTKGRRLTDFYATIATFDAILIGLVLTLVILAITKRPLPALPISIGLGLGTSILTMHLAPQFMNKLSSAQIFL